MRRGGQFDSNRIVVCGVAFGKTKPKPAIPLSDTKPVVELTERSRPSIVTVTQIGRGELLTLAASGELPGQ